MRPAMKGDTYLLRGDVADTLPPLELVELPQAGTRRARGAATSKTLVPLLSAMSVSAATVTGGTSLTGTVTLFGTAPSGGTTVALSSSNASAASVPPTVLVPAGATAASFVVTTYAQTANALATIGANLNGEALAVPIAITP